MMTLLNIMYNKTIISIIAIFYFYSYKFLCNIFLIFQFHFKYNNSNVIIFFNLKLLYIFRNYVLKKDQQKFFKQQ